jgi:hypothetical protein
MGTLMKLCFVLLCAGSDAATRDEVRLITTQDVYHNDGIHNRLVAVEGRWLIGGFVHQPDTRDVMIAGALPLRIQFHPRVTAEGGAIVATGQLPRRGTIANWMARVHVAITETMAFEIVHVSNGGPGNVANPSIDSIGLSFKLR